MAQPTDKTKKRIPVVGLLGAPGSGKSTVARMFESLGCTVIDADQLSREAFRDADIQRTLADWWGEGVLVGGQIDRQAVAKIVFADPGQRERLEGLVHPFVNRRRAEIREEIVRSGRNPIAAIIEDCPLLLEAGLADGCDVLVFVACPLPQRQARVLASRGWSAQQLAAREAAQMPLDTKRAAADYTIDNVGDNRAIQARVADVLTDIRQSFPRVRASRG